LRPHEPPILVSEIAASTYSDHGSAKIRDGEGPQRRGASGRS
jgi:hypothetical protein